jgi:hypothetical protein
MPSSGVSLGQNLAVFLSNEEKAKFRGNRCASHVCHVHADRDLRSVAQVPKGSFHKDACCNRCVSLAGLMRMHPIANLEARWIFGSMKSGTSDQVARLFFENGVVPVTVRVKVILPLCEYPPKTCFSWLRLRPMHPQLQFGEALLDSNEHRIDVRGIPAPKLQAIGRKRCRQLSHLFSMADGDRSSGMFAG